MAAVSTAIAAVGTGIGLIQGIDGANRQSSAMRQQADFVKQQAETNAKFAEANAEDAIFRGDLGAARVTAKADKTGASQRAAMAAQGLSVGAGDATSILDETRTFGELDALTVKNNAWREAWGYKAQAQGAQMQASMEATGLRRSADNTLLTGGLNAVTGIAKGMYGAGWFNGGGGGGGGVKTPTQAGGSYFDASNVS